MRKIKVRPRRVSNDGAASYLTGVLLASGSLETDSNEINKIIVSVAGGGKGNVSVSQHYVTMSRETVLRSLDRINPNIWESGKSTYNLAEALCLETTNNRVIDFFKEIVDLTPLKVIKLSLSGSSRNGHFIESVDLLEKIEENTPSMADVDSILEYASGASTLVSKITAAMKPAEVNKLSKCQKNVLDALYERGNEFDREFPEDIMGVFVKYLSTGPFRLGNRINYFLRGLFEPYGVISNGFDKEGSPVRKTYFCVNTKIAKSLVWYLEAEGFKKVKLVDSPLFKNMSLIYIDDQLSAHDLLLKMYKTTKLITTPESIVQSLAKRNIAGFKSIGSAGLKQIDSGLGPQEAYNESMHDGQYLSAGGQEELWKDFQGDGSGVVPKFQGSEPSELESVPEKLKEVASVPPCCPHHLDQSVKSANTDDITATLLKMSTEKGFSLSVISVGTNRIIVIYL